MEKAKPICVGQILSGPLFNEPMRVETIYTNGPSSWILGLCGTQSERFRRVTLSSSDLDALNILDSSFTYRGDGLLLRLGLQAYSLGIAYEFDPYFGLSISRVDPLPHQLEAVYDYLLRASRVRFLLADDAGAGKTIMAGLLIRELKLRGLAERIVVVCPANLAFQWQRELKEKFDEKFLVLKGQDVRDQFGVNQRMEQDRVITSLDLAKRDEILPGLHQVHWDLAIIDEPTPIGGGSGAGRAFSVQKYGMLQWADLFTARQKVALMELAQAATQETETRSLAAVNLSHITERNNSLCRWYPDAYMETVGTVYGRQALPMVWDFAEAVPLVASSGGWEHSMGFIARAVEMTSGLITRLGQVQQADATSHPLPHEAASVWFTDPPYYDAVPYADL
jgi:hypothetical protein